MQDQPTIFREEAVESHFRGSAIQGDLLRISPQWMTWTYWLLIGLILASSAYVVLGSIDEYATGTGIVRDVGRTNVTAITSGTIRRIAIRPGQEIEAKQPLVYFDDRQEQIELERLNKDFNSQQLNWLKNPNNPVAHQQVVTLRAQIDAAEMRLKDRTLLSTRSGIVQDIRIRPNQLVNPGELLLTIVGGNDSLVVIAILPGRYRPLLKKGDPLRLELTGFGYAYQRMTIDEVGNEVVGPNEIRRFLGQEVGDSLKLGDSSVIVQARLPSRSFQAAGGWHDYHDGMQGTAEARVRSESILVALVPGLKAFLEGSEEYGDD